MNRLVIVVRGGVVQEVRCEVEVPGVVVEILDFDDNPDAEDLNEQEFPIVLF